jgi:hypothetical protein
MWKANVPLDIYKFVQKAFNLQQNPLTTFRSYLKIEPNLFNPQSAEFFWQQYRDKTQGLFKRKTHLLYECGGIPQLQFLFKKGLSLHDTEQNAKEYAPIYHQIKAIERGSDPLHMYALKPIPVVMLATKKRLVLIYTRILKGLLRRMNARRTYKITIAGFESTVFPAIMKYY